MFICFFLLHDVRLIVACLWIVYGNGLPLNIFSKWFWFAEICVKSRWLFHEDIKNMYHAFEQGFFPCCTSGWFFYLPIQHKNMQLKILNFSSSDKFQWNFKTHLHLKILVWKKFFTRGVFCFLCELIFKVAWIALP